MGCGISGIITVLTYLGVYSRIVFVFFNFFGSRIENLKYSEIPDTCEAMIARLSIA